LFFNEKREKFIKRYAIKRANLNYKKNCEEEGYNAFNKKIFGLRLNSIVNKLSTTKSKSHSRYYLIQEWIKNK
jgi:hypothetical protein